jgi:hypothetical protein
LLLKREPQLLAVMRLLWFEPTPQFDDPSVRRFQLANELRDVAGINRIFDLTGDAVRCRVKSSRLINMGAF